MEALHQNTAITTEEEQVVSTSSDPKPIKIYYDDSEEKLLKIFMNCITPTEGVIKYKVMLWTLFPKSIDESKQLAKSWSKQFALNQAFNGYAVIIYFHTVYKTIRFDIKKYIVTEKLVKIPVICMTDTTEDDLLTKFESSFPESGFIKFNLMYWTGYPFTKEECTSLANKWSIYFENKENFSNKKVVVYFNKSRTVKFEVTVK